MSRNCAIGQGITIDYKNYKVVTSKNVDDDEVVTLIPASFCPSCSGVKGEPDQLHGCTCPLSERARQLGTKPPPALTGEEAASKRKWYVGAQNDGISIIDQPPRPSTDVIWNSHKNANVIATVYNLQDAHDIVAAHNKDIQ